MFGEKLPDTGLTQPRPNSVDQRAGARTLGTLEKDIPIQ